MIGIEGILTVAHQGALVQIGLSRPAANLSHRQNCLALLQNIRLLRICEPQCFHRLLLLLLSGIS